MRTVLLAALISLGCVCAADIAVIAHRGEHLEHIENTLPAFSAAIEAGADYFELDVRTTADGKLVLMHDATVDRTMKGNGSIAHMTFDEVRALRAGGQSIPTFEEALALARGRAQVYVDAKQVSAPALIAALENQRMLDRVVVYGGQRLLKEVHSLRPAVRVMPESISVEAARDAIRELAPKVFAFSSSDWRDPIIRIVKESGAGIYLDCLGSRDNPASWQDAIDRGATGIQTDHPAELVSYLRSKSLHR